MVRQELSVSHSSNIWFLWIHSRCSLTESPHCVICYHKRPASSSCGRTSNEIPGLDGKSSPPQCVLGLLQSGPRTLSHQEHGIRFYWNVGQFHTSFICFGCSTGGPNRWFQQQLVHKHLHLLTTPPLPVRHFSASLSLDMFCFALHPFFSLVHFLLCA